jgi:hypothetical protein
VRKRADTKFHVIVALNDETRMRLKTAAHEKRCKDDGDYAGGDRFLSEGKRLLSVEDDAAGRSGSIISGKC